MGVILYTIGVMNVWTGNNSVALGQASLTLVWTVSASRDRPRDEASAMSFITNKC